MGKRTYFTNTTIMALTYLKLTRNVDLISYNDALLFDGMINNNLDMMKSDAVMKYRTSTEDDPQNFFYTKTGMDGNDYEVIADRLCSNFSLIKEMWEYHVSLYSGDIIKASLQPNTLKLLGITDEDKVKQMVLYLEDKVCDFPKEYRK